MKTSWFFEPGHTAAEFSAKHMMVTWVRGYFKDVHGMLHADFDQPENSSTQAEIETKNLWTGKESRDKHLRSPAFLNVERFPKITFESTKIEQISDAKYKLWGKLTIRDITREVLLDVDYQGQWETPWWEGGVDKWPKTRMGFCATTVINRHDYGVSWQEYLDKGGVVVSDNIYIKVDVEAIKT